MAEFEFITLGAAKWLNIFVKNKTQRSKIIKGSLIIRKSQKKKENLEIEGD